MDSWMGSRALAGLLDTFSGDIGGSRAGGGSLGSTEDTRRRVNAPEPPKPGDLASKLRGCGGSD